MTSAANKKWADQSRDAHAQEADELAKDAAASSINALANSTVNAGMAAVLRAKPDGGLPGIQEAATDAASILADPRMSQSLSSDLMNESISVRTSIVEAVTAGYRAEADAQSKKINKDSGGKISLTVKIGEDDISALTKFPIAGQPADVWVSVLRSRLRLSFESALVSSLDQADPQTSVPSAVQDAVREHAERVGTVVREGFWAGTRAANVDVKKALSNGH